MKDEKIVNVQDTTNAQLLEKAHKGAKELCAYAGGLGHTKAYCAPLEPTTVGRVAEPAILPLGRVETQSQVAIGQIYQHPEVVWLNALGDGLQSVRGLV